MKRENQIENAAKILATMIGNDSSPYRCFIMGAKWSDEFPTNPGWRSCKQRMPKLGEKVLFKGYDNVQVITPVVLSVVEKTIKEKGDRFYFLVEENELSNS